ncbi:hypothetical protein H4V97_002800 [Flavobacterium sp. CG_23.5]|uniref:hypothetical protein n=1 Tax=unclassified Flavobacterium TaxID=196869 RepID=UPI0018C97DC7|nr:MULTISPECIES: hypothetical protein [unclassified Flavobacterium]MBG6111278.1 hypothetical protein [Flavobacterium sp. CG_9.10]MBP2284482.1 hypothetical protein [Flavobacterium sp. CG_23.5]
MKKHVLLNFLTFFSNRDKVLVGDENEFKMGLSRVNYSRTKTSKYLVKETSKNKNFISSTFLLVVFFLFTGVLYAQQPSCNLSGPLKGYFDSGGGSTITIISDVYNTGPNTTYSWIIDKNIPGATIVSGKGTSSIQVKAGTKGGSFKIKLTVTNPGLNGGPSESSTCTKSVTVGRI